jgi:hypothetical protein
MFACDSQVLPYAHDKYTLCTFTLLLLHRLAKYCFVLSAWLSNVIHFCISCFAFFFPPPLFFPEGGGNSQRGSEIFPCDMALEHPQPPSPAAKSDILYGSLCKPDLLYVCGPYSSISRTLFKTWVYNSTLYSLIQFVWSLVTSPV